MSGGPVVEQTASLFPDLLPPGPVPVEELSPDRRRTLRQREAVEAGLHPLTGQPLRAEGGTCGSCALRVLFGHNGRTYPKCSSGATDPKRPATWPHYSRGAATDVRAWWPACPDWQQA